MGSATAVNEAGTALTPTQQGPFRHRESLAEAPIEQLVIRARQGDGDAWSEIIRRFEGFVRSQVRRHRIPSADAEDIAQTVWLRLYEHLGALREPRALPGWIAVTTANLCRREMRNHGRTVPMDPHLQSELDLGARWSVGESTDFEEADEALVGEQRRRLVREGLAVLSPRQRDLLVLCSADPAPSYAEISRILDMPVGSIGPTRARCLQKLRDTEAVRRLVGTWDPDLALAA